MYFKAMEDCETMKKENEKLKQHMGEQDEIIATLRRSIELQTETLSEIEVLDMPKHKTKSVFSSRTSHNEEETSKTRQEPLRRRSSVRTESQHPAAASIPTRNAAAEEFPVLESQSTFVNENNVDNGSLVAVSSPRLSMLKTQSSFISEGELAGESRFVRLDD